MGQKLGMDPEVIRAVGLKLRAQERTLAAAVHAIDVLVEQGRQVWMGPSSAAFADRWYGGMRAQLAAAEQAISGLAISAARQADQQQQVSSTAGAGGGGSASAAAVPGRGGRTGGGSVLDAVNGLAMRVPDAAGESAALALGAMGLFSQGKFHTGRYTDRWPRDFHFKKWEVFQALGKQKALIGGAGVVGDVLSIGTDSFSAYTSAQSGDTVGGVTYAADAFADGLGMVEGVPVATLGSTAIHLAAYSAREAQQIDVDAIPETLDYASKNGGVVLEELAKATVTVGTKTLGWLL